MSKLKSFFPAVVLSGLLSCFLFSCFSAGVAREGRTLQPNQIEVDAQDSGIQDLTMYLRRIAGVQISGERESADITIRGVNSINMDTSPLFIVDGNNLGRNYSQVYAMINIADVQRVTVLKSAGDIGMYGVQGSNGVIVIEMKK